MPPAISTQRDVRWVSLYVLCTGMLMIVLDITVMNVALPSIQRDLGFSQASLAWVINAYLIAFAGLLLLSGRLGDLLGGKRVFLWGLALFTASSFACGIAQSSFALVAARFVQGAGAAMASAVILAVIVTTFTDPGERARAIGVFSFTASAGGAIGLLLGGIITQSVGWHWAFLVNVPVGVAAILIARPVVKAPPGIGLREGADLFGAFTITASLMLGVYAVVQIPERGLTSPVILTCIACAAALFVAFVVRQATARRPLVPLRLFRSRNIVAANAMEALLSAGLFGFFFLDALYLRRAYGYGALETGLAFLPLTITSGALSLGWAERLVTRFGAQRVLVAGCAFAALGLCWLVLASLDGNYFVSTFMPMLLVGIGMGAAFPPLMLYAMADTTEEDAGVASGVLATSSEVGGAVGLAILATITATGGFHTAFIAADACVIVATLIAALVLRPANTPSSSSSPTSSHYPERTLAQNTDSRS
jgi:EmrB/QacA subfamily drug resistance transporter